tara:strand:- start:7375 stop:7761 length:387 start_codon:yes stop_codon:yes gene_type:complete
MCDMDFGLKSETNLYTLIKDTFDEELTPTEDHFAIFDFESPKTLVELKTRKCASTTYPDTMIGLNKIEYANKNNDKTIIFCFSFTDGLYYFKHQEEYNYNVRYGGRFDRGRKEVKKYCYIKRENLIKV